ncbi:hypothetical protein HMPREF2086_00454 [Helicobacter macacae MIT 99-5501]|uniref:Autotransporter domain-containing protein n=2 Tax=Helicobacter TaxID=209 RepID=V8CCN9_9HELI|nr:hypothetical protein HMPREF2086_00454 [Helicobacter macacae MIT 99-5501]
MQNPLDISVSTKPQYDNVGIYAKPQYDKAKVSIRQYDKAKVSIRQYDKVDSIASECKPISSPSIAGGDSTYSPSLAEGARGWVNPTSASQAKSATANDKNATANQANTNSTSISKANISKLDSELSAKSAKNTHPQTPSAREGALRVPNKVILREGALRVALHAHNNEKLTRNDEKYCHTERSEVSKKPNRDISLVLNMTARKSLNTTKNPNLQNPLDISVSTKPQYDNVGIYAKPQYDKAKVSIRQYDKAKVSIRQYDKVDSIASECKPISSPSLAEGARGWVNPTTTPTSRKLALSLLTASALSATSLELAIAGTCTQKSDGGQSYLDCTGDFAPQDLQTAINSKSMLINLGRGESNPLSVGAGTVTATISNNLVFRSVSAPNTDFVITGTSNAGLLLPYTLGNHTANASTIRSLTVSGNINNQSWGSDAVYGAGVKIAFDVHAGTQIGRREADGTIIGGITISSGASITSAAMAIYGGYDGGTRSTFVSQITNNGSIQTLNLGYYKFSGDYASLLGNYFIGGASGTISTLNVYQSTLTLDSNGTEWSKHTINGNANTGIKKNGNGRTDEHIAVEGTITNLGTVGEGAIRINIGEGVTSSSEKYEYKNIILDKSGGKGSGKVTFESLRAGLGTKLHRAGNDGFTVSADVSTSYGSSMWRLLTLSYARRSIMVQNIIDTMTTKTFHSDRYYNQEVELRLLQYDMSRLTNRSSKFAKQTRKNQKKVDKMRDKLAKLTLEQSKGQNLDKGYNNFELIDQLDAIFIPYTGRRDWRVFLVPYATHSYAQLGIADATEWAGGGVAGVQRNLKGQGILSTYLTYEYAHATTEMLGAETIMQTNSLQGGVSYFKIFPITGKVWEATLKASGRVGVDMPLLSAQSPVPNIKFSLVSNKKGLNTPLMWSLGAEVRGGLTFYQFKQNSYVSPEIGLSYDVLSPLDMKLEKAKYQLGGNEYYPSQYWHLPQLSASVKYYKVYGNMFRTNLVAGLRYNMLNTPTAKFKIGGLSGEGKIALPAVYGYLDLDLIWVVKKNHELSAGYNGVFYANKFGKDVMDKFNGVSTSINLKYAHWFGGTDYVTDADGNAISRSVAEGKSKKSKKSKSKKSKKSKKKVYYIDG